MGEFSSLIHGDDLEYAARFYGASSMDSVISLSHNINQLNIRESIESNYPERGASTLTEELAEYRGIDKKSVILLNGASQGLYLIASYFTGKKVLIITPTYSGYEEAFSAFDARCYYYELGFEYKVDSIPDEVIDSVDLVVVANPNNPTGTYQNLKEFAKRLSIKGKTLLVDESFSLFTNEVFTLRNMDVNIIVLESLTKAFGLAGLRIGAVYACSEWIEKLEKRKPPWSVNQYALIGLKNAFDIDLEKMREILKVEKKRIEMGLNDIGVKFIMGSANFYIIKTCDEEGLIKALLKKGFYVRPLSNFYNSKIEGVRVAIGTEKINKKFLNAIQEVKNENNID